MLSRVLDEDRVDAITFTSSSTVRSLLEALRAAGRDPTRELAGIVLACMGPITAQALREAGLQPGLVAEVYCSGACHGPRRAFLSMIVLVYQGAGIVSSIALFEGLASICALLAAIFIFDQHLTPPKPYKLVWALGLLFYAVAAGAAFAGETWGWSVPSYVTFYYFGGVLTAAFLGLGSFICLARARSRMR